MAKILNDVEIKRLIGTSIIDGDSESIRPNSYVLRLGSEGEFLNAEKSFELGQSKRGIRIPPGNSVAVTSIEKIDFRQETVEKIFPGCALHALITPTTDLSREGIIAPATQIDAGYFGTPNWTINNTSANERRFLYRERLFRLTILKLEKDEVPLKYYEGDYQGQTGYVRSQRKGAPIGIRECEWENSLVEGGPEALLENLLKSGYPWHLLGQQLKHVGDQLKIVTDEYASIDDSLESLRVKVDNLSRNYSDLNQSIPEKISSSLNIQAVSLQNRWLLATGSMLLAWSGLAVTVFSNQNAQGFLKANGPWIGLIMILFGTFVTIVTTRKGRDK